MATQRDPGERRDPDERSDAKKQRDPDTPWEPDAQRDAIVMQVTLDPDLAAVRAALNTIITHLSQDGLDQEELWSVEIVLAEALNNIVLHAYADGPADRIALTWSRGPRGYHFHVMDRGAAMPKGRLPLSNNSNLEHAQTIPEGGFGWFLIRDLARDIDYRRLDGENHLRFRLAVGIVGLAG